MNGRLRLARAAAGAAAIVLLPTALLATVSHLFLALAVVETALLAIATAYAVYVGVYRYPR